MASQKKKCTAKKVPGKTGIARSRHTQEIIRMEQLDAADIWVIYWNRDQVSSPRTTGSQTECRDTLVDSRQTTLARTKQSNRVDHYFTTMSRREGMAHSQESRVAKIKVEVEITRSAPTEARITNYKYMDNTKGHCTPTTEITIGPMSSTGQNERKSSLSQVVEECTVDCYGQRSKARGYAMRNHFSRITPSSASALVCRPESCRVGAIKGCIQAFLSESLIQAGQVLVAESPSCP